jgi:hypothetical protein
MSSISGNNGISGSGSIGDIPLHNAASKLEPKEVAAGSGKAGNANPALGAFAQIIVSNAVDQQGKVIHRDNLSNLFNAVTLVDAVVSDIAPNATEAEQLGIYEAIVGAELKPSQQAGSITQNLISAEEQPNARGLSNLMQAISSPIDVNQSVALPKARNLSNDSVWSVTTADQQLMTDVLAGLSGSEKQVSLAPKAISDEAMRKAPGVNKSQAA